MELQDLLHRVVEPRALAGERSHLRERGHAHVEVVGPERLRLRALARERAVGEAELPVRDVVAPVVDDARRSGPTPARRALTRAAHMDPESSSEPVSMIAPKVLLPAGAPFATTSRKYGQAVRDELELAGA